MSDIKIPIQSKVVCINDSGWREKKGLFWRLITFWKNCSGPKKDDVVTVTKAKFIEGELYYDLLEWPEGPWEACAFVPIQENFTSISYEKVLEDEKQLVSAN